jgi:uncharacterized protein
LAPVAAQTSVTVSDPVAVTALAVKQTPSGMEGVSANISVAASPNGNGHVFVDTRPLTAADMQGSARIAARVAASVTGYDFNSHDFFVTVRSDTPVIGGPSAGAIMSLASVAALENVHRDAGEARWNVSGEVMATGTITPDGSVGPVGGIPHKAQAARNAGAREFLVPAGQGNYTPKSAAERDEFGSGPVNVTEYCADELGIACREVRTIEQLVYRATGHRFDQPELGDPPSTATYADELRPLSDRLIDRAERVYDTWDRLNNSDVDEDAENAVQERVDRAVNRLQDARTSAGEDRFYSAASQAFQSSIASREADQLLEFLERGRSLDYVASTIDRADENVTEVRQAAENATIGGIQQLYTVGAAQERVSDAENRVEQARQALDQRDVQTAIQASAYAVERAHTVEWWLGLGATFGPGPDLERDVDALAGEFVDVAEELITYATSVSRVQPQEAQQRLQQAKRDRDRGFYAAALVEAIEAQVLATLPLELARGSPSEQMVDDAKRQAAQALQKARGQGVEPVLPVAMFEFGGTQEDTAQQLRFYRNARVLAGVSNTLTSDSNPTDSTYVGEPDRPEPVQPPSDHGEAEETKVGEAHTQSGAATPRSAILGGFVAGLVVATVLAFLVAARGDG